MTTEERKKWIFEARLSLGRMPERIYYNPFGESKRPFQYEGSFDEVYPERFFKALGWRLPALAGDRKAKWRELQRYPQRWRQIEDVEIIFGHEIERLLDVFTPYFCPNPAEEKNLQSFREHVYSSVRKILHEVEVDSPARIVSCWKNWRAAVNKIRANYDPDLTPLFGTPTEWLNDARNNGQAAIRLANNLLVKLFAALHPSRIEIDRVKNALVDMVEYQSKRVALWSAFPKEIPRPSWAGPPDEANLTVRNAKGFLFSPVIRGIVRPHLRDLDDLAKVTMPTPENIRQVFSILDSDLAAIRDSNAEDRESGAIFLEEVRKDFQSFQDNTYHCEISHLPEIGNVAFDGLSKDDPEPAQTNEDSSTPSPASDPTPPPKPDPTPPPIIEPVPPTLTVIELADFIQHFTNGAGEHNFPTRNDLDTFTEGVVGESVCYDGSGRGKCLAHYIREHQKTEPETVFRLCKALLELDLKRNPIKDDSGDSAPFDSLPDWQREANELRKSLLNTIRAAEARAVEQAKKNAEDNIRAAEDAERRERKYQEQLKAGTLPRWQVRPEDRDKLPKTPAPATPPAQPSPPTPPQGHLTVELSPEDRQRLDRIAINTAGTKTSVQNATRALKEGNAIAAESLEAERQTAENTAKIAESLSIRQAESEGMWTREAHPNMRPCVKMCKIGEWILFNGDKEVKYLHSDYQWEILTQLLEAPGEGWVRLDSGWRQKFKGGQSKQDVKDISARIVSESGGPGSGGSSRFRLE